MERTAPARAAALVNPLGGALGGTTAYFDEAGSALRRGACPLRQILRPPHRRCAAARSTASSQVLIYTGRYGDARAALLKECALAFNKTWAAHDNADVGVSLNN